MRGRHLAFLLAAILVASCDSKSPLASTPPLSTPPAPTRVDHVDLQFGAAGHRFGSAVQLLNGTPTFYLISPGFHPSRPALLATRVTVYAVDKNGVYEDVTTQAEMVSSNTAIARPDADGFLSLRGGPGQVTVTATYSGASSSLTFVVIAVRPPMMEAALSVAGIGEISYTAWVRDATDRVTSLQPGAIQWSSSDPRVVSVSGSTLRANVPGIADLTMRYNAMETSYRITIPPPEGS